TVTSTARANVLEDDAFDSIACVAPVQLVLVPDRRDSPPERVQPTAVLDSHQQAAVGRLSVRKADEMIPDRAEGHLRDLQRLISDMSLARQNFRQELHAPSLSAVPTQYVDLPARRTQSNNSV